MTARIDPKLCTGCETCLDICPAQAIVMRDQVAKVNPCWCVDCGTCIDCCPVKAIDMDLDDGLTRYNEQQEKVMKKKEGEDVVVDVQSTEDEVENLEERIEDVQKNDSPQLDVNKA